MLDDAVGASRTAAGANATSISGQET